MVNWLVAPGNVAAVYAEVGDTMPLTVKYPGGEKGFLLDLGIPQAVYEEMQKDGVFIKLHPGYVGIWSDGLAVDKLAVSSSFYKALQAGILGPETKKSVAAKLLTKIGPLLGWSGEKTMGVLDKLPPLKKDMPKPKVSGFDVTNFEELGQALSDVVPNTPPKTTTQSFVPDISEADFQEVSAKVDLGTAKGWPMFPLAQLKTAPLVKLRNAHKMYQPVQSTSAGKRYILIAGNDALRVAVFYKGSELSVRIEGPAFASKVAAISAAGVAVNHGKEYASLHLSVPNEVMARKAVGAILLALDSNWETPLPDLKVIKQ